MPDAPLWVFYIPLVARNDMDVNMRNALTGCFPHIKADIETIRSITLFQQPFDPLDHNP